VLLSGICVWIVHIRNLAGGVGRERGEIS
jgi:hypothetical protein